MTPQEFQDELERMVDKAGIRGTLESLIAICYEKADHLRANWQDEYGAKDMERIARRLETAQRASLPK